MTLPAGEPQNDGLTTQRAEAETCAERVEKRIVAIEKIGGRGRIPNHWRESLFLAFTADDIAAQKLFEQIDELVGTPSKERTPHDN